LSLIENDQIILNQRPHFSSEKKETSLFNSIDYFPVVISIITGNPMYFIYNMAIQSFIGLFDRTIDRTFRFIENNDISFFINDTHGVSGETSMRFAVRPRSYYDGRSQINYKDNLKYMDVD